MYLLSSPGFLSPQIIDIQRPIEVPQQGLLCDILWSDPDRVSLLFNQVDRDQKMFLTFSEMQCSFIQYVGGGEDETVSTFKAL